MGKRFLVSAFVAVLVSFAIAPVARAQTPTAVTATGKGITGCALLGGELVVSISSAVGLRNGWALAGLTVLGAAGGGIGGYFLETKTGTAAPMLAVGALAAGVLMLIPATVIVASATAYSPGSETLSAPASNEQEPAGPRAGTQGATESARSARTEPSSGSLLHLHDGRLALGAPAPVLLAAFDPEEVRRYGVEPHYGLSFPLMRVSF